MDEVRVIDIAGDFSRTPGGRFRQEGRWSGEEFRQDILQPALAAATIVVIDLDGPDGFASSFLEEVFGGIVRQMGPDVSSRIQLRAARFPSRERRAREFMEEASRHY